MLPAYGRDGHNTIESSGAQSSGAAIGRISEETAVSPEGRTAGDAETSTVVAGGIRCRATLPQAAHAVRTATSCSKGDETKPVRVELSSELMLSRCGDVL